MTLSFLVSALRLETSVLLTVYVVPCLSHFMCLLAILLSKVAPKPSAEVLSGAPKPREDAEKTRVFDMLHAGISYSAFGKGTRKTRLYGDRLIKTL